MAVAHSAASESHTGTTGSTAQTAFSWTHTQTGTPQGVLVFVHVANSAGNPVSSVTYGGVTLTRVSGGAAIDSAGEAGRTDLFFAGSGLGTGNQTITVNRANTADIMYASAATVTALTNTNVTGIVLLQGDGALTVQSVTDGGAPTNSLRYAAAYSGLAAPPPAGTGSTLLNSIDFGNYGIALVRETTAGTGARNVGFNNATTDDRAAVHVAVRELWNRTDTETVGAFTLTGNDATLTKTSPKVMDGGTGAFTLTGQPADLRHNPDIEAGVGAFTLAGQPADIRHNPRIEGGTGAFSFTGNDATLTEAAAPKVLTAETGAFTLSGNPASTLVAAQLGGDVGKFFLPERNLLKWSEQFNQSPWTLTGASITVNQALAPDGLPTGDLLTCTATGGFSGRVSLIGSGQITTFSVYAKKAISDWLHITIGAPGNVARRCWYNLATGIVGGTSSASGGGGTLLQQSMVAVGNGWYRCVLVADAGAGLTWTSTSLFQAADGDQNTNATLGNSIYIWGAQLEQASAVSDYDPTGPAGATDATLRQQYKLTAEVGAFVFTGQPATLAKGRTITAETGTFTAAGQPATLRHNPRIEANTGSFALSGGAPVLVRGRYLSGGSGTFTETGQPATFRRTWAIQGGTGSFALTGNPAGLTELGAYEIDPIVGAFALTGQAANLTHGQKLQITVGIFSLTGQPATLKQNQQITAGVGAFNLTGQPATLRQNYLINAAAGSFSLLGNPATLTKQSALQINAQIGVFNFVGNQAGLAQSRSVDVQVGIFNTTGNSVNLQFNRKTYPVVGIFTVTGNDATLTFGVVNKTLEPATGSFIFAGNPATLQINTPFSAQNGAFLLSGKPVNFSYEQRRRVVFIF